MKILCAAILFAFSIGTGWAQMPRSFADSDSTSDFSTSLDLRWNTNNAVFHAPATIDMLAYVWLRPRPRAGDAVRVEFFANAKRLGSGKAVWHDEERPKEVPGHAVPMHILAAQFYPAEWILGNASVGDFSLTAKATWTNGESVVSAPLMVKVLP